MKRFLFLGLAMVALLPADAQRLLSLDSCRALALRNNKQLRITALKQETARNTRKAARTKYLPKVDVLGGYQYFNREISLLNSGQKSVLNNLGTNIMEQAGNVGNMLGQLAQGGIISPQTAQELGAVLQHAGAPIAQAGNQAGQQLANAFKTDTKSIWSGSVMVRQPLFMGGAITAANRMADIAVQLAANEQRGQMQATLYEVDQTYWLVVSLRQKLKLATSYRDLVKKLDDDVKKMIREGVATRADGLKVDVKVNEADMQITQAEDGLTLAKMLLCQYCGLPLEEDITLEDENSNTIQPRLASLNTDNATGIENRSEIKMLHNAVAMSREATRLIRAEYMPHIVLTGGYLVTNPNLFDGFHRRFAGVWNVGVTLQMPVWNWFESVYKVRASKAATEIAAMELGDAQEKIDLQITQSRYKLTEATKRLAMANKNLSSAEENLRCANIGFKEGVMETTDVMAAQTAWQLAQSQKIDAQVEVMLAEVNLQKVLGILE